MCLTLTDELVQDDRQSIGMNNQVHIRSRELERIRDDNLVSMMRS